MDNANDLTMNPENLQNILERIAQDGCSILRVDRGDGSAGPVVIGPDDLHEIEIDEAVYLEEAPAEIRAQLAVEVQLLGLGDIEDYTHVGIKTDYNGWTGYYLLWIP